ncbi:MAG: hypothetical protein JXA21_22370 [Anaerolineae bacterium]|nr:hypothetical protein [Anaerolineae bacterium]
MSSILIQPDWPVHERQVVRQRQHAMWVVPVWFFALLVITAIAQRLPWRLVYQAIFTDAACWGVAMGLMVWYALRYRPERTRMAFLSALYVTALSFLVNIFPKWNLSVWPPEDAMDASPMLYWGLWHLMFWGLVVWLIRRYPLEMRAIGMGNTHWRRDLLVGILGGGVLSGHFLFSVAFTGSGVLHIPPLPYVVWQVTFETVATMTIELLYRGVIYHYLEREYHLAFWVAGPLSALATVSQYLVKVRWTSDLVTTIGVLFYVIVISLISATLYRWTRSLWPGCIAVLVFHIVSMLR